MEDLRSTEIKYDSNQSYLRAKKRIENIRKFYKHLVTYLVINLIISSFKISRYYSEGDNLSDIIFNVDNLSVWVVWGIFLLFHAYRTFSKGAFLGSDWEEKKIREIMNKDNYR